MSSWPWMHFTKIDSTSARCKHCEKVFSKTDGCKSLVKHLKEIHSLRKEASHEAGEKPKTKSSNHKSWVLCHFKRVGNHAVCNYCNKEHPRAISGLVQHLTSYHSLSKEFIDQMKSERMKGKIPSSWTRKYFNKIDNQSVSCKLCNNSLSLNGAPRNLREHLKHIHARIKTGSDHKVTSWFWNHYSRIDKESASCKHCLKVMARSVGKNGLVNHLINKHSITKDSKGLKVSAGSTLDKTSVTVKKEPDETTPSSANMIDDNCYVCTTLLLGWRRPLTTLSKFTKTPLYHYLGKIIILYKCDLLLNVKFPPM